MRCCLSSTTVACRTTSSTSFLSTSSSPDGPGMAGRGGWRWGCVYARAGWVGAGKLGWRNLVGGWGLGPGRTCYKEEGKKENQFTGYSKAHSNPSWHKPVVKATFRGNEFHLYLTPFAIGALGSLDGIRAHIGCVTRCQSWWPRQTDRWDYRLVNARPPVISVSSPAVPAPCFGREIMVVDTDGVHEHIRLFHHRLDLLPRCSGWDCRRRRRLRAAPSWGTWPGRFRRLRGRWHPAERCVLWGWV